MEHRTKNFLLTHFPGWSSQFVSCFLHHSSPVCQGLSWTFINICIFFSISTSYCCYSLLSWFFRFINLFSYIYIYIYRRSSQSCSFFFLLHSCLSFSLYCIRFSTILTADENSELLQHTEVHWQSKLPEISWVCSGLKCLVCATDELSQISQDLLFERSVW